MKKKILYVEPFESGGGKLLFDLMELEPEWELIHVPTSLLALASLRDDGVDAVIADMDLPDSIGIKLLDQVMAARPRAIRFALSAMKDMNVLLRCLGTAHQYLVKPCDAETVRAALRRAFAMELWLPSEKVVRILTASPQIPSPPRLYFQAVRALRSDTSSLDDIGKIISMDPAMTARMLQAVNSPMFGLGKSVVNPAEAVFHLGAQATLSLMLVAHTYSYFDMANVGLNMEELWRHSLATARFAVKIAQSEVCPRSLCDEASTSGMLHDIGKLVLAANHGDRYRKAFELTRISGCASWEAEQDVFGVNHAEVGACLSVIWGLPASIVEAIALHHHPVLMVNDHFSPLAAVHAANAIEHAESERKEQVEADAGFLGRLGVYDRLEQWRTECRELENP